MIRINTIIFFIILIFFSCLKQKNSYIKTNKKNVFNINYNSLIYSTNKKEINLSFKNMPNSYNPYKAYDNIEIFLKNSLYSTLISLNPENNNIEPCIAKQFFILENGLKYYFKIRDDIYFSDGKKLTIEDVISSLNLLKTYLNGSDYYNKFFILNKLCEIEKKSENEFYINLDKKNSNIYFALAEFPILQKSEIESIKDFNEFINKWKSINNIPKGSGPFIIDSFDIQNIILVKNKLYFNNDLLNNKYPYTEKIIIKFYQDKNLEILAFINNEIDIINILQDDFENLYNYYYDIKNAPRFIDLNINYYNDKIFLLFNNSKDNSVDIINNIDLRKYIIKLLIQDQSNDIVEKVSFFNKDYRKNYDDLEKVSFNEINNNIKLNFIIPEEDSYLYNIGEIIKNNLEHKNIKILLNKIPYYKYFEYLENRKDFSITLIKYYFSNDFYSYYNFINDNEFGYKNFNNNSKELENIICNLIDSEIFNEDNNKIKKSIDELIFNNYNLVPIKNINKQYYILKNNIFNFKINNFDNNYNIKTLEQIIKIDNMRN